MDYSTDAISKRYLAGEPDDLDIPRLLARVRELEEDNRRLRASVEALTEYSLGKADLWHECYRLRGELVRASNHCERPDGVCLRKRWES